MRHPAGLAPAEEAIGVIFFAERVDGIKRMKYQTGLKRGS